MDHPVSWTSAPAVSCTSRTSRDSHNNTPSGRKRIHSASLSVRMCCQFVPSSGYSMQLLRLPSPRLVLQPNTLPYRSDCRRKHKRALWSTSPLRRSQDAVITRATWRNIPEDGILHSHRRENLKSYLSLTGRSL
jgi:hypothetical protein